MGLLNLWRVRRTLCSFAIIGFLLVPMIGTANAGLLESVKIRTGDSSFIDGEGLERGSGFTYLEGPRDGRFGRVFTPADFAAAATGDAVYLVNPLNAQWTAVLPQDPLARWIGKGYTDEGGPGSRAGIDGVTTLLAYEFNLNTVLAPSMKVILDVAYLADDAVGDITHNEGLFINGNPLVGTQGNAATDEKIPTLFSGIDITNFVTTGSNVFYFYNNDAGGGASGIVLSADITVVNEPASMILLMSGLVFAILTRRRQALRYC